MPQLDPDDLRAYARRDWSAVERETRRARAAATIKHRVELAIALNEAARQTRPDWPTDADRRADLAAHLRVKALRHDATGMEVDLVVAGSGLERLALEPAEPLPVAGVTVPVASATDLVVMMSTAAVSPSSTMSATEAFRSV